MSSLPREMAVVEPPAVQRCAPKVPAAILVVEDEPEILAPLSYTLRRAGYVVFEAEDGMTACRIIGSQHPDLILLDIMLPDLNGWEVCRMLRQHPDRQVSTIPVMMLTALNTPEDKLQGLELGADAYLPKPYSQQEVLLISRKLIERHRRAVDLERGFAQLSQVVEQQRDLHSLLFHELRNQLTVLCGYAQLLQGDAATSGDARITAIHRSSDYLYRLAEDFLLVRQIHGGQLHLPCESLLAQEIAEELLDLYRPVAGARGITLQLRVVGSGQALLANRPALRIILSALLDNAIKYGPANHPVLLICHYSDSRLTLEVYDSGRGIPAADRERVFDRFYRGGDLQEVSGSGLGLYGVRILARALGGDAEVGGELSQGNSVQVWIPLGANAREPVPA